MILLSKVQEASPEAIQGVVSYLNRMMEQFKCPRRFSLQTPALLCKPWDDLTPEDFSAISGCGFVHCDHEKLWFDPKKSFSSLFFMHVRITQEELLSAVEDVFAATDLGTVFRIKGYLPLPEGDWLQINATPGNVVTQRVPMGQEILIVIGQDLHEANIRAILQLPTTGYQKAVSNSTH